MIKNVVTTAETGCAKIEALSLLTYSYSQTRQLADTIVDMIGMMPLSEVRSITFTYVQGNKTTTAHSKYKMSITLTFIWIRKILQK